MKSGMAVVVATCRLKSIGLTFSLTFTIYGASGCDKLESYVDVAKEISDVHIHAEKRKGTRTHRRALMPRVASKQSANPLWLVLS